MKNLTVFFDRNCGFCRQCKLWLLLQPKIIELELLATDSPLAKSRYPNLKLDEDLTVVDDQGGVYCGADAWIMVLYALEDYRAWSYRFASPLLKPFARRAFEMLSKNRLVLSNMLGLGEEEIAHQFAYSPDVCSLSENTQELR